VDSGGSQHLIYTTSAVVATNVFRHVALTYDKDSGVATLYCNGAIVLQQTLGSFTPQTTYDLYLGQRPLSGGTIEYAGLLDEVSLYNRALMQSEIQAIYSAGSGGKCGAPLMVLQPKSQLGFWGKPITFTAAATGADPLAFQWRQDGNDVAEATNAALSFANLDLTNAGAYTVVVTNFLGSVTSSPAILTVNPAGVSIALYPGVSIDGVVGLTYGIQSNTNLANVSGWAGVTNITLSEPTQIWYDSLPASLKQRYYRVVPGPISIP
jgi:hypothetical protein